MKSVTAVLHHQKRRLTVMTAHRAQLLGLKPSRDYGYVIRVEPPIVTVSHGEDIEGIGWWPHRPRQHQQHFFGWYKYKSLAESRAAQIFRLNSVYV